MKIHKIEGGTFFADGGAMFGVIPKKVWQMRYPCNENNMCQMSMRCLVVEADEKLILIDTGVGTKQMDDLKYYNFREVANFEIELNKLGYGIDEVTDVVLTHLHFDHCGTCTILNSNSEPVPTFPYATYWIGRRQWENFLHPNPREEDAYFDENILPISENNQLKIVSKNRWLMPNIELRLHDGHTVGQIVVYIHTKRQTLVYVGDVIPLAASISRDWISAYDTHPITSAKEKIRILDEATEQHQVLFFEHDAYTECCTVKKVRERIRIDNVFTLKDFNESHQI